MCIQWRSSSVGVGCRHAEEITRRGGPDIACTNNPARLDCERLFGCLKAAALPAFGIEDDLLTMPHSVIQKIQFGGLLGLQSELHPELTDSGQVANIHGLVEEATEHFGDIDNIPCDAYSDHITAYQLKRRGRR